MAIDAKMDFLRQAEKELADRILAGELDGVMNALSDVLQGYRMEAVLNREDGDDDLLMCYLDALRVQNRSEKTIQRYEYMIRRLMDFVKVPTRQIMVYHLRSFLSKEKERGLKDTSLESMRQVYSAYFNWLYRESLIEKNPAANLGAIKCAKKEKKILSKADIERLTQACKKIRDKAIIHFLASTGCRVSEMVALDRNQVDLERMECVVHGKGDKERKVYLNDVARLFLEWYLNQRTDSNPALFIGKGKVRLEANGVRVMLKKLQNETGVEHVHPHKFRRTLATEMAMHGIQIQELSRILGHEKIDTSMKYVVMNDDKTRNDYRRFAG